MSTHAPLGPTPKRGRPKAGGGLFIPTKSQRDVVQALVSVGLEQPAIAKYIGVSVSTLKRHFKLDLRDGRDRVYANVVAKLVQKAYGGHSASIFFLLSRRFDWKTVSGHQVLNKDGQPISFDSLDDSALAQFIAGLRIAINAAAGGGELAGPRDESEGG